LHVVLRIEVGAPRAREHDGCGDTHSQTDGRAGEGRLRAVGHRLQESCHTLTKRSTPAHLSVTFCQVPIKEGADILYF
jgi:hypothetical protein